MCYVIENFQSNFTTLRWNLRLSSLIFLRNVSTLFHLTSAFYYHKLGPNLLYTAAISQQHLFWQFFVKGFFRVLNRTSVKSKFPLVTNIAYSIQFWALKQSLHLFYNYNYPLKLSLPAGTSLLHLPYHYYLTRKLSTLGLLKHPYRQTMFCFLRLLLTPWYQFNLVAKSSHLTLFIAEEYKVLRYYNLYFFKIYNF